MIRKSLLVASFVITSNLAAQTVLNIDGTTSMAEIQPTMYGIFFEDINFSADGGIYAELIKNRSFEFTLPKMGWSEPKTNKYGFNGDTGQSVVVRYASESANTRYLHIDQHVSYAYLLENEGFRGIGVKEGALYDFSIQAANANGISELMVELIDDEQVVGSTKINFNTGDWSTYEAVLTATKTADKAKLRLSFKGEGSVDIDFISLFPQDTWKGRKGGLRKDLVTLLDDLNPGFVRFPGGCIVEGRTLERRYQWKKTVGPVTLRENLINRWNTEFDYRLTPDYYQSFGLGFYEYFLLSEDLGAEPLPILGCGMACQFNTGELVPLEELEPYIQDALDLIEFANGSVTTKWGKLRSEMGHPEPFNMKYIGIGNEQWGEEYIKRYTEFEKIIKAKHPEIKIVSTSGPFPDGDFFEYGWKELKKLSPDLVDEHYYRAPDWFRTNASRYDSYDRSGPKVFAGEYAAHTTAKVGDLEANDWESALSEAAFMTGLERNADIVTMTSYAPLFANVDAWQWKTDLIWFNNLESYGTPSYYVQKMYANHAGTEVLSVTSDGEKVIGQDGIYASVVKDKNRKVLIVKVVNTSDKDREISLNVAGLKLASKGAVESMVATDLRTFNSIESPQKLAPKTSLINFKGKEKNYTALAQSFSVIEIEIKK